MLLVLIVAFLAPCFAPAQGCDDVRRFDFRNANIKVAATDDGGHSGGGAFQFHDGVAYLSDGPDWPQSHDWRVELVLDRVMHPDSSDWIRVIVLEKNHLTGTGDWHYIMAFTCRNGSLIRLFQYGSEGVTLEHLGSQQLALYQAAWTSDDARCCPTRHAEILYDWNARKHRFDHASSIVGQGFRFVPDEK